MSFQYLKIIVIFSILAFFNQSYSSSLNQTFNRNFWSPTYHGQRLNYCAIDGKSCGMSVANEFCKLLGYKSASKAIIEHNVGLTNYVLSRAQCQGWTCDGFKLITCTGEFNRKPAKNFYYREHRFAFPRFENYRIDWCFEDGHGCGKKAANSFCKRMGYMKAKHFEFDLKIQATKALGNHKLCFGKNCRGFSTITCYR